MVLVVEIKEQYRSANKGVRMFKRYLDGDATGTSGLGEVLNVAPAKLIQVFGTPDAGDDYKVSGQYIFGGPEGEMFTVYDYTDTALYNMSNPHPDVFWESQKEHPFHIGGDPDAGDVNVFIAWMLEQINGAPKENPQAPVPISEPEKVYVNYAVFLDDDSFSMVVPGDDSVRLLIIEETPETDNFLDAPNLKRLKDACPNTYHKVIPMQELIEVYLRAHGVTQ